MPKVIRVRAVPNKVYQTLARRAAKMGISISDYLLGELREIADQPTLTELQERLDSLEPPSIGVASAETGRKMRDNDSRAKPRLLHRPATSPRAPLRRLRLHGGTGYGSAGWW